MNDSYPNEDAWTSAIARRLSRRDDVVVGIGDDAAVVRCGAWDQVYTSDAVVEGVHFLPEVEPQRIGRKMVGRLLSDLAAMGATPDHILLNIVVPPNCPARRMNEIYDGAERLAVEFGASIIGGDTIAGPVLALHGFASGRVPSGRAILRSGASAGDLLYVTGRLGGSRTGKHLDFIPRVREGVWLREGGWAVAMMDVSDGLARDLPRLCASSGVGAIVDAMAVPAEIDLDHALHDGEDYELLFAVRPEQDAAFVSAWKAYSALPCTRMGVMEGAPGAVFIRHANGRTETMLRAGYDHLGGSKLA